MNFLLDTNILIPAEPTSPAHVEPGTQICVELLRLISEGRHGAFVHPVSLHELQGDKEPARRALRAILARKYPVLPHAPPLDAHLCSVLGKPKPGSHNENDLIILSALAAKAVDYLVTEDDRLRRRAARANLAARVATAAEAVAVIRALFPALPTPPPTVHAHPAHALDAADPIFAGFRKDYPQFDSWLDRCKREQRQCWTIGSNTGYAGVAIVKPEDENPHGLPAPTLKLCTFKISDSHRGHRYGELLLKTVFEYAFANGFYQTYTEVFPKYTHLRTLLQDFGFQELAKLASRELVYAKPLTFSEIDIEKLAPLDFNIRYGPPNVKARETPAFVVPIKPVYHRLLFPEAERQLALLHPRHPFGNSIRKAYLSRSKIRRIVPGSLLLFYRSEDTQAVTVIGVAEETLVSSSPQDIAQFVGKRTVYSYPEIEHMARSTVLATLFRQARVLDEPWSLELLKCSGVITSHPQSFVTTPKGCAEWLERQLTR